MSIKEKIYDVIIIGSGPAGMTASIYASRADLKVLLMEEQFPGGKVFLTQEIENWPSEKSINGAEFSQRMHEHALEFGTEFVNEQALGIEEEGQYKIVKGLNESYKTKTVIIASGTVERPLGIPGEKEFQGAGVSYCAVCDGAFFRNKTVVVIGGGNTAYDNAIYLTRYVGKVELVMRRDKARAEKYMQQKAEKNEKIEIHVNMLPLEVMNDGEKVTGVRFAKKSGGEEIIACDAVFPLVGLNANTKFVPFPEILNKDGFIKVDSKMQTSKQGIYAAGDVCDKELRQIVTATNDGAIAAQNIIEYIDNWK